MSFFSFCFELVFFRPSLFPSKKKRNSHEARGQNVGPHPESVDYLRAQGRDRSEKTASGDDDVDLVCPDPRLQKQVVDNGGDDLLGLKDGVVVVWRGRGRVALLSRRRGSHLEDAGAQRHPRRRSEPGALHHLFDEVDAARVQEEAGEAHVVHEIFGGHLPAVLGWRESFWWEGRGG